MTGNKGNELVWTPKGSSSKESDTWFLISAIGQGCRCCGADSKLFPCGFFAGALSQAHLNLEIEWMQHVTLVKSPLKDSLPNSRRNSLMWQ